MEVVPSIEMELDLRIKLMSGGSVERNWEMYRAPLSNTRFMDKSSKTYALVLEIDLRSDKTPQGPSACPQKSNDLFFIEDMNCSINRFSELLFFVMSRLSHFFR